MHRRLLVAATAACLLGACAALVVWWLPGTSGHTEGKGDRAAAKPKPPGRLPNLDRYYAQKLSWGPCAPFARTDDQRTAYRRAWLQCAYLEVPLDYTRPAGRTARIGVLRDRVKAGQPRLGSLVVNPGGPGSSGMELAATLRDDFDAGPFDVVGFDPRGVGASTPSLDCDTDQARDIDRADDDYDASPAGVARAEDRARQRAQRCVQRSGGVDVLANSGTRDVARDLDVLREVLGDPKLTYLGYSYGTEIGTSYAEQFSTFVRAMVLDGAVDPMVVSTEADIAQMAAFQRAFVVFATNCARSPRCPLGTDPARATEVFQSLTRPLVEHPARVSGDRRRLSYGDAVTAVLQSLYWTDEWRPLTDGLARLRAGDGAGLLELADEYYSRRSNGTYPNDDEALLVINCVDGARVTDPAVALEASRRTNQVAPFADPGTGASAARDTCAFLPITPTGGPHRPDVTGLPKVLVVSTTGDPATPYADGVNLAAELNAALLSVRGSNHTAVGLGDDCVDGTVRGYLIHPDQPVTVDRCPRPEPVAPLTSTAPAPREIPAAARTGSG
jgi:pimeloyl-ACP methyl ester carboxylesterase